MNFSNWKLEKHKTEMKSILFLTIICSIVCSVVSKSTKSKIICATGLYQHSIKYGDSCYNIGINCCLNDLMNQFDFNSLLYLYSNFNLF